MVNIAQYIHTRMDGCETRREEICARELEIFSERLWPELKRTCHASENKVLLLHRESRIFLDQTGHLR